MAKHLTDRDVERVVEILDGWRDKLTWGPNKTKKRVTTNSKENITNVNTIKEIIRKKQILCETSA